MVEQADTAGASGCSILAVAVDLGLLGYYKYTDFFVDSVNAAAGTH